MNIKHVTEAQQMSERDVLLWQNINTPSLARSGDGGICYLDNASPNYGGKPMYVCHYLRSTATLATWESAKAWFAWRAAQ